VKRFYVFILRTIGSWLPNSNKKYIGVFGKIFRLFLANRISNGIGKNVNIEKGAVISPNTTIGDNSGVGINCELPDGVNLGRNIMMGPDCLFYPKNHKFDPQTQTYRGYTPINEIKIEDNAWIGARCIVLSGVTIGKGALVGAGSVVTKDVPPYTLVAGNPAVVKKELPQ